MVQQPSGPGVAGGSVVGPGIGVGTWAWGNQFLWGYDPQQDATLAATFQRAVQLGLSFFDTADSYGTGRLQGRSEQLLGEFCAGLDPARRQTLTLSWSGFSGQGPSLTSEAGHRPLKGAPTHEQAPNP